MLSTPDLSEFTEDSPKFKHYFGRAVNLLVTGRFYSLTIDFTGTLNGGLSTEDIDRFTYTLDGLKTTDVILAQFAGWHNGYAITSARCETDGVLTLDILAINSQIGKADVDVNIIAFRQEKE